MPLYWSAADVVESSWSEGLPAAAIEALACRCPLAPTSVGGIPDVLASFKAGAAVPSRSPEALSGAVIDVLSRKHAFIVDRGITKGC
jgi:glycosyltransferase involved in cell wall biosynthesis